MKQSPTTQKKNKKTALVSKTKRKAAKDPNAWVSNEDIKSKKVSEKRADRMEKRGWTKHKRMKDDSPAKQKPDYIDIDGDGNKKESMKEAAKSVATQEKKKGEDRSRKAKRLSKQIADPDISIDKFGKKINKYQKEMDKPKNQQNASPAPQHKTNSWEEEDVKRGREQERKGNKGHAQALFDDAHDSYNWKGGNDGHESWFHKFKKKNPVTQLKAPTKKFKDFDQMDTWDAKSVAKQTPFQNLLQEFPDMPASDTLPNNYKMMSPDIFGFPTEQSEATKEAFQETYGDYDDGDDLRQLARERNDWGDESVQGDLDAEDARLRAQAVKDNAAQKAKSDSTNQAKAIQERLYQEYLKKQGSATPQNKTMAYKKSCAYRQDGHGESKGDQSATHTDYSNYKGTDKGYHGKDGSSHGDQSATHKDYAHPIHKHMKR